MDFLMSGLSDTEDVQLQCHQILIKLAHGWPGNVIGQLDKLLGSDGALEGVLFKKKKAKAAAAGAGAEGDRANDVARSALRAVDAVGSIAGVGSTRIYQIFMQQVRDTEAIAALYASLHGQ